MSNDSLSRQIEQRRNNRVQFFLLHTEHQNFPLWFFQPAADSAAIPGILVDASRGGVQVLLPSDTTIDQARYRLTVWAEAEANLSGPAIAFTLMPVWVETPPSLYPRIGFELLEPEAETMQTWLEAIHAAAAQHSWWRCTLTPLVAIN
ncbi:hypothetical protein [Parvibium lacunae]|nr:hypothetical protein [Parvibium lacunae]